VGQVPAAILAPQDLRIRMVESDREIDIGIVSTGAGIRYDVRPQQPGIGGVDAYIFETDGDFGRCGRLLQYFFSLLRVGQAHLAGAIDNDLGRVGSTQPQDPFIGCLSIGKCR
jgi:hypothetical protein